MWPVLYESALSILWAYVFVGLTAVWSLSSAAGHPPAGASPVPNWWGMVIASLALVQLGTGVAMDWRYERSVATYFGVAVFYPIVYWMLMAVITVRTTPVGLLRTSHVGRPTTWRTARGASTTRGRAGGVTHRKPTLLVGIREAAAFRVTSEITWAE